MTAAAGLLLALSCIAIVAIGFGLAVTAWPPARRIPELAVVAGLTVGAGCLTLAALHWLAHHLT